MDDNVRWDDAPTFGPSLSVQVFSPPANSQWYLRLLGHHTGIFYHVLREQRTWRPVPCLKDGCKHCKSQPAEWKAFFPALIWMQNKRPNWQPVVAEFTSSAFTDLAAQADLKHPRGLVVEIGRGPTRSRVRSKLVEVDTETTSGLPPTFDVKIVLRRLFGFSRPQPGNDGAITLVPPQDIKPINLPEPIRPKPPAEEPTGPVPSLMKRMGWESKRGKR